MGTRQRAAGNGELRCLGRAIFAPVSSLCRDASWISEATHEFVRLGTPNWPNIEMETEGLLYRMAPHQKLDDSSHISDRFAYVGPVND